MNYSAFDWYAIGISSRYALYPEFQDTFTITPMEFLTEVINGGYADPDIIGQQVLKIYYK